jgi:hypothetical protein
MRITALFLALLLLPAVGAHGQTQAPRAASAVAGPASAAACELVAGDGLRMTFTGCPVPDRSARTTGEVEIVEYRNGDAPASVSVQVAGAARGDLAVLAVDWRDLDSDDDGILDATERARAPAAAVPTAARRRPGRVKYANVTLKRGVTSGAGTGSQLPWPGDLDGDGFPLVVTIRAPGGGEERIHLEACTPEAPMGRASADRADEVTLACATARVESGPESSAYARWISRSSGTEARGGAAAEGLREERRAAPTQRSVRALQGNPAARTATAPVPARTLSGVRLAGWSVVFTPNAAGSDGASWTLEMRVGRIEMAN